MTVLIYFLCFLCNSLITNLSYITDDLENTLKYISYSIININFLAISFLEAAIIQLWSGLIVP